jgi:hypothetical protein
VFGFGLVWPSDMVFWYKNLHKYFLFFIFCVGICVDRVPDGFPTM